MKEVLLKILKNYRFVERQKIDNLVDRYYMHFNNIIMSLVYFKDTNEIELMIIKEKNIENSEVFSIKSFERFEEIFEECRRKV